MPRIALVLSGAVSLGSFEAGVLDELLYILDLLARNPDPEKRYELDVVTGASAGSMTAALVARAVMHDFRRRDALYDAWVKEIDLEHLLRDPPDNALLSKDPIQEIADRHLTIHDDEELRPASFAPEELRLWFTLSNMSGVDFELPVRHAQGRSFVSTFFTDRRRFLLPREASPGSEPRTRTPEERVRTQAAWDRIRQAAIASGNFPFAFRPMRVFNDPETYRGSATSLPDDGFTFVDGGLFNNEPLRAAVELARERDGAGIDPDRRFILVDANLNHSAHLPPAEFGEDAALGATALRIFGALRGESSANDWLRALRTNNELAWRDLLTECLGEMIAENEVADPDRLIGSLEEAGEKIVAEKRRLFGPERYPDDYLERAYAGTQARHEEELHGLTPGRRKIMVRILFLLNSVAGLDKKSKLDLNILYATPDEMAGDRAGGFAGFFEKEWREHDYRVGRRKARELLPGMLGVEDVELPRESRNDGRDYYRTPVDLGRVRLSQASREKREAVRDLGLEKAEALFRDSVGGWEWVKTVLWWLLLRWMVKGKVEGGLEL